ncbi:sulfotransferase family protein [Novosphingobium pentaromativorans]|nr:sulfotransferase family protein [Novosphingobium pentaromativorans]AIT78767.1 hypothetical protein JI59_02545 [Novosphingobium pentaromativorans US6-1]
MALKVIGAGLGRTGTLSLKLALEHLGFGPCFHMVEIVSDGRRQIPLWSDVADGKADWDAIFDGFASTVDYPACSYWRELADHYPQAKVVLSTRDADDWFNSVSRTIFSPENLERFKAPPFGKFLQPAVYAPFGDRIADRAFMVDYFRKWEADVVAAIPPQRLHVHRIGEGWEGLCDFLEVPVPDAPYPVVNTSKDMVESGLAEKAELSPEEAEEGARRYKSAMRAKAFGPNA